MNYVQDLKIQLNFMLKIWIRFELCSRLIFKDPFQGRVLRIKLNFKFQGKCLWLSLYLMPKF
jgi:hypothetical protein